MTGVARPLSAQRSAEELIRRHVSRYHVSNGRIGGNGETSMLGSTHEAGKKQ